MRILDAATEEFSANGFAGARVSEIAARAAVNQQLIAYYFGGSSLQYLTDYPSDRVGGRLPRGDGAGALSMVVRADAVPAAARSDLPPAGF